MKSYKIIAFIVPAILVVSIIAFRLHSSSNSPADQIELANIDAFEAIPLTRKHNDRLIGRLEEQLRRDGENARLLSRLGHAYLQQVRESGDFRYYRKAERAFVKILENYHSHHFEAMAGRAEVFLGRHRFEEAHAWAEKAREGLPYRAMIYGILSDAEIELGRYEKAVATIQKMVDLRPDISSYSRVSYARELHGDVEGAISAMKLAVQAGLPGAATTEWCRVQLATLYLNRGELQMAEAAFQQALYYVPNDPYALAGLAKIRSAQQRHDKAETLLQSAISAVPLPDFCSALAQVYELMGNTVKAEEQYDLARKLLESERDIGIEADLELAMLGVKTGKNPAETLQLAKQAYAQRPTIFAADVLAWAHYQNGEFHAAQKMMRQALRLGTQSAEMHFHAGMIAWRLQQHAEAQKHLEAALAINPNFCQRSAAKARTLMEKLAATD